MNTNVDWLSLIKRWGPDAPAAIRRIVSKADEAFLRKESTASIAEELLALDLEMSLNLYEYLRVALGTHTGLLSRQFVFALQSNQTIEHCFKLFENLSRAGFSSPVEKSRNVVILLQYLEGKLPPVELKPLVEAMADELERCRVGCEENLRVLQTFLKVPPDDSTQSIS